MKEIKSVLIIDDNEDDILISTRALKKDNLCETIFTANDGLEALEFLKNKDNFKKNPHTFPPTLILLDLNMPRMGGLEFIKAYEELDSCFKSIIIFVVSTSTHEEDRKRVAEAKRVKGFILKPFSTSKIKEVLADDQ
jgi:CheY-like chemotaxis protein